MTAIGIDFGTTNSVAALHRPTGLEVIPIGEPPADWAALGFDRVLPSVVALDAERRLQFGWQAKLANTDRKFEATKRLFKEEEITTAGGEEFYVEEIAASIFRHIRQAVLQNGIDFTSAVITVPANSRGLARYRTKVCAGLGEIEPLALLNEPTAAAMAYSRRHMADEQMILVFDFGGGTLDVTLLETREGMFFEQASAGVSRLGGIDFDNAILRHIASETPGSDLWTGHDKARLRLEVEKAKIRLSDSNTDETVISDQSLPGFLLSRPKFNELTAQLVEKPREAVQRVLADMRMGPGDIDVLLLVGGTSKIPAVRHFVSELVGHEPATGIDPMTAIGEGAAVAAAILTGQIEENDFFVSTEHALGTVALSVEARQLVFSPVIHRNQKLPARQTETFFPVADYQETVHVTVIEGDPELSLDHPDNVVLTEFDVPIDPPRPMTDAGFELTYSYDTDGLLHVDVLDLLSGEPIGDRVTVAFTGARDPSDLVSMAGRVRSEFGQKPAPQTAPSEDRLDPASRDLIAKAQSKVIPFVEENDADQLQELVNALESATDDDIEQARHALEDGLRRYSYLL